MANERDTQGIMRAVFDEPSGRLKVDAALSGATVTVDASDLRIGAVEIQDKDTGDRAAVDSSNNLQVKDTDLIASVDAIKNTDGIKKITDALPAGANKIGKISLTDSAGALDVPVVNNGTDNAIPIVTDARQEQAEVLAATTPGAGVQTAAFDTGTEGYYSNRLFIESNGAATVEIFYSASATEFPTTASDSITFAGAGFELASLDVPGWAKYAKLKPDSAVEVTADIFRSR